jgi:hypothetical protein
MAEDRFKPVRDYLVVACNLLAGSSQRTEALSDRLRAVERQMDWRGDPLAALYALPTIIADLGQLKDIWPSLATGTTQITPDPEKVLLPGVADAIEQLEKAVKLLKAAV